MDHHSRPKNKICMIAYSEYLVDARIKREAETLASNGWEVSLLTLPHGKSPETKVVNKVRIIELSIRKYRGYGLASYFLSYINFFLRSLAVCTLRTIKGQIDMVHVHNMPDFLVFAAILPRILGKKIIIDIHDSMLETYSGKFGKLPRWLYWLFFFEEKMSAAFAHRVICVNHVQMKPLIRRGIPEKKITVLLNVPDHKIFNASVRADPSADTEHFNLVYHGTLDRALGIDMALQAVNIVRQDIPSVRFHILGKGKDQEALAVLIRELRLEPNVDLRTEFFSIEKLPEFLHAMHVGFISNRKNEATGFMLPVKLLEYVSLGIPAIAPALDTIQYYFNDASLCYYEPENVSDMAGAIRRLYGSAELRRTQAENAYKMLDKYGWPRHQLDLLDLYTGLAGG